MRPDYRLKGIDANKWLFPFLLTFLRRNGIAPRQYFANCRMSTKRDAFGILTHTILEYAKMKELDITQLINWGFTWAASPEGQDFWYRTHEKFVQAVKDEVERRHITVPYHR